MKYLIPIALILLLIFALTRDSIWDRLRYGEHVEVEEDELQRLTGGL